MLPWQKRLRLMTLVVAVGVAAAVFLTTGRREAPRPPPPVPRVDPAALVESSGAIVRQVKGEKESFRLEAEKQLSYPGGATKLLGVKITLAREGRTYVVTGTEAKVGDNESYIELIGNVHMTASDGLDVTGERATYSEGEGIVRVPGPVTFRRGRMNGTGLDFTYDKNRDQIGLSDRTSITFAAAPGDTDATAITAGSALLDRKEKFSSFERNVHIVRADQVIDAGSALADLTEDEQHITALALQWNARITMSSPAPGGLRAMSGEVINLTYAPNSEVLERAVLAGTSKMEIAGEKDTPDRTLSADALDLHLAPDGATVTALNAQDRVVLNLPGPRGQASKEVRSTSLVGSGDATNGLTRAVFTDEVEYRESGGKPVVQRVVTARSLETSLHNGFAEIRDANFSGNVVFRDGSTRAGAATMNYQVPLGVVDLNGNVGAVRPRVVTDEIEVDAGRINMLLEGPRLKAAEAVNASMKPSKPGASPAQATKMPGIMQQDRPVQGKSDALAYDGASAKAEFTGAALVIQGDTSVRANMIALDAHTGNLAAAGAVQSKLVVRDTSDAGEESAGKKPEAGAKSETSTSVGTAEDMKYDDATRRVTYVTNAHLVGPQGDVTGTTIVLTLGANGQDINGLDSTGNVTFREPDRVTKGDRLEYDGKVAEYSMFGSKDKLVEMVSRKEDGCRLSTGDILIFKKGTDSLRIDGNAGTRTQTKTVTCAGQLPGR